MTTLDISLEMPRQRVRYDLFGAFQAGWTAFAGHRRERRMLVALSRLEPRVLHDMGFDPEQVYRALDGSWDEVAPAAWRAHLPRRSRV